MKLSLCKVFFPKACLPDDVLSAAQVCMFDEDLRVHLCELTPSYELHHLYVSWEPKPGMTDERLEELDCELNEGNEDVLYMHCADVRVLHRADHTKDAEDETPEEIWESWRGSWRCNQHL